MRLKKDFFEKKTEIVAKELLGKFLVYETEKGKLVGRIVETEAYLENDSANHAFKGETKRNQVMFGNAGNAYIYFIYGKHYCLNVVTRKKGVAEAVLIRALEPIEGIEIMKRNRKIGEELFLTNGPAKLVEAFGIGKELNGTSFLRGPLKILSEKEYPDFQKDEAIIISNRIGISKEKILPLRFYLKGNKYVSQK